MEQNPYQAPEHYAEKPKRPWLPTSTGTKVFAGVMAFTGYGQLMDGGRLADGLSIAGGLILLTVAAVIWFAGDQPFFRSA